MRYDVRLLAALLILVAAARADEGKSDLKWAEGLEAALKRAAAEDRLVLLREVHCDCDGTKCSALESARRPSYLERFSTRRHVEESFVPAVAHAPKDGDVPGLFHPTFLPPEFRRDPSQIRTLIVTPGGHVLHRLDLCPQAEDVNAELAFARKARAGCFTAAWVPVPAWEERLRALHAEHARRPETWHGKPEAVAPKGPGMAPWEGYAKLDLAWQPDLDAAMEIARRSDRLVLYFQVVGNLDKEGC